MAASRVLIVGGGVAGLEATLALSALAADRVSIEVVAPEQDFVYRPFAVAEPFRAAEVRRLALPTVISAAGGELVRGEVASIDPEQHVALTADGRDLSFDLALVAAGTTGHQAVPGALTFGGPQDEQRLAAVLRNALAEARRAVVFAVPAAVSYLLPLYELALLSAAYLADQGKSDVEISLVTPEPAPLSLFGSRASDGVRELFEVRGIAVRTGATPVAFEDGFLSVVPDGAIRADTVVSVPRLEGVRIEGLEYDGAGFVRTSQFGRVDELDDVYAAGDITAFPIKQGGIAAQQADAAAESIAARVGAPLEPRPFRPLLRGLLLTGVFPRFLYAEPGRAVSKIDTEALWSPPAKIAGKYLGPFLASRFGVDGIVEPHPESDAPVEFDLEPTTPIR